MDKIKKFKKTKSFLRGENFNKYKLYPIIKLNRILIYVLLILGAINSLKAEKKESAENLSAVISNKSEVSPYKGLKLLNWWDIPYEGCRGPYLLCFQQLPQAPSLVKDDFYLNACIEYGLGNAVWSNHRPLRKEGEGGIDIAFLKKNNLGYIHRGDFETGEVNVQCKKLNMQPQEYRDYVYNRIYDMEKQLGKGRVWLQIGNENGGATRHISRKLTHPFSSRKEAYNWFIAQIIAGGDHSAKKRNNFSSLPSFWQYAQNNKLNSKEGPFLTLEGGEEWSVHYLYELGLSCVIQEWGGTDGKNQITMPFIRGAARQYNGSWGSDNAPWYCYPGYGFGDKVYHGATRYNEKMEWVGGRTGNFLLRMWIHSYFSGADIIIREGSFLSDFIEIENKMPVLTPAGWNAKRFADFTLRDFTERGNPYVPVALLLEKYHGFDFSAGANDCDIWGAKFCKSISDQSIMSFFEAAFPFKPQPNKKDWSDSDEYYKLANTEVIDPRKDHLCRTLEPARWGESFDVILEDANIDILKKYKAVFLLGGIKVNKNLLDKLKEYTRDGGIVLINSEQIGELDKSWLGVDLTEQFNEDAISLYGSQKIQESIYSYRVICPTSAKILGRTEKGDPIITENTYGKGKVILTTSPWYQDKGGKKFLNVVIKAINDIMESLSAIKIEGPPIDYLLNRTEKGLIITLINNSDLYWKGKLVLNVPPFNCPIWEMWRERRVKAQIDDNKIIIPAEVPKYGFSIYTIGHFKGQNVALGKPVTTFPPTPPHKAHDWPGGFEVIVDGKVNIGSAIAWTPNLSLQKIKENNPWIQVDLEEVISIYKIKLIFCRYHDRYCQFKVIASEDEENWKEIISQTDNISFFDYSYMLGKTFTFKPINARYVRLIFTGGTQIPSLAEMKIISY